ncbi:hypothetical protein [Chryseosolibacter indicus]|uniref:Uncharacterized protein n=1 Tax=Chryseosolibacter indicus TaxID=2782351 RepID=A0ABS5W1L2_9BACT|nr:hypothetical protein [Chryseosolibacter indicus]MBT1706156.1 hypothetical protein [Chryseosolibacter indicus]
MRQKQVHILIGCADARDLSQVQLDAVEHISAGFLKNGIVIEMHTIRAAGSFVTPDVVMDIKRTFEQAQRNSSDEDVTLSYYVHIQTHGHLTEDSNDHYISHVHDLKIVDGSPLNCGMLGASSVGVELERMIVEEKPEIEVRGKRIKIYNDTKIKLLLKEVYAYDGYLAGDWIKSIDLLRTHPRHQRTILEKAIASDPELKVLNIQITSGIQDYAIHSLIRVDDGEPEVPFWDQVQQYVRMNVQNDRHAKEILILQSQKQKPLAGLLSLTDPRMSSREHAAKYYMDMKGIAHNGDYLPNTLFNMTGSSFDIPYTPFGPYVIAGFFFSVKHLALLDQMVMGYDTDQTGRMMQKIKNDPLMNMIVKKFKVNLIPINQVDLMKTVG